MHAVGNSIGKQGVGVTNGRDGLLVFLNLSMKERHKHLPPSAL
jgi:hypothetical protein